MTFVSVLFWFMVFLLGFTYVGYPVFIYIVSAFVKCPAQKKDDYFPSLTLLIPAYNEAGVLQRKLENSLGLDYPPGLLEIIVISDASTDATNTIADSFAEKGVRLIVNAQRSGKTQGLNRAVKIAQGEILVFTDANAFFEEQTFKHLVAGFKDESVGLITGSTRYYTHTVDGSLNLSMGLYSRLERKLKLQESQVASCVGADGAVFALRKELYLLLDDADINDFVIPLNTIRQGFRVVCDPHVFCREEQTNNLSDEFSRQVRISNRTARALLRNLDMLNPFYFGPFAWMLLCHKWLRFIFPFIVLATLMINFILVMCLTDPIYQLSLGGMILLLVLPFVPGVDRCGVSSIFKTFIMTNIAILFGWKRVLFNEVSVVWEKRDIHAK